MKKIHAFISFIFICSISYSAVRVDSVTVDSVWKSDTEASASYKIYSRDCRIGFVPQGGGLVSCCVAVSLDSGKTWTVDSSILQIIDDGIRYRLPCGKKAHLTARVFGQNRTGVVFRVRAYTTGCKVPLQRINSNDIEGWMLNNAADSFAVYSPYDLMSAIDGGYEQYADNGLIKATMQHLKGPGNEELSYAFLMDFGTDAKATAMFMEKRSVYGSATSPIPGYDTSVAFANTGPIDGIIAFAHFKNVYVELPFSGFTNTDAALETAAVFLKFIEQ